MPWSVFSSIYVNSHHVSTPQEITNGSQKQSASTLIRACLDNQLWLHLMQNFLVHPEIERALEHMMTQPECVPPCLFAAAVVQRVELVNQ